VKLFAFPRSATVLRRGGLLLGVLACLVAGTAFWRRDGIDTALVANVRKGELTARLATSGTLRPIRSITYHSPLAGREVEITELVPEGTRVNEGDLLVRLDTTELQRDLQRARQEARQSNMELQVAEIDRQEAEAAVKGVSEGEGALTVEEARTRLQLAQKKVDRLRQEYEQLKPLMDKGFITREELSKTTDALDQAEEELGLNRRRTGVVIELSHPRDRQRTTLQLAQKESQLENARARTRELEARLRLLLDQIQNCSIYARQPGMVVYEEYLNASPRRKIRAGDRVTASQGLVTIPEVNRMLLEASVSEAEVHRVRLGQPAAVRVEAFPDARLTGNVTRIGTLARASADHPFDDKRFDLIVELDSTGVDLRPEMTARADIVVGTRSNVLLVPVNAIFERQGKLIAQVVRPSGVETRLIDIGESDDVLVEVVQGLREGEQVALTDLDRAAGAAAPVRTAPATGLRKGMAGNGGDVLQPR